MTIQNVDMPLATTDATLAHAQLRTTILYPLICASDPEDSRCMS